MNNDEIKFLTTLSIPKKTIDIMLVNNELISALKWHHINDFCQKNNIGYYRSNHNLMVNPKIYPYNHLSWIYQTDYQKTLQFKITDFILNYVKSKIEQQKGHLKYIELSHINQPPNRSYFPYVIFNDLCFNIGMCFYVDNHQFHVFLENTSEIQIKNENKYKKEISNRKSNVINNMYFYNDHYNKKYQTTILIELVNNHTKNNNAIKTMIATKGFTFINKHNLKFKELINDKIYNKDDILNIQNNIDYKNKFITKSLLNNLDFCIKHISQNVNTSKTCALKQIILSLKDYTKKFTNYLNNKEIKFYNHIKENYFNNFLENQIKLTCSETKPCTTITTNGFCKIGMAVSTLNEFSKNEYDNILLHIYENLTILKYLKFITKCDITIAKYDNKGFHIYISIKINDIIIDLTNESKNGNKFFIIYFKYDNSHLKITTKYNEFTNRSILNSMLMAIKLHDFYQQ